jgi:hypothetical protein
MSVEGINEDGLEKLVSEAKDGQQLRLTATDHIKAAQRALRAN